MIELPFTSRMLGFCRVIATVESYVINYLPAPMSMMEPTGGPVGATVKIHPLLFPPSVAESPYQVVAGVA